MARDEGRNISKEESQEKDIITHVSASLVVHCNCPTAIRNLPSLDHP